MPCAGLIACRISVLKNTAHKYRHVQGGRQPLHLCPRRRALHGCIKVARIATAQSGHRNGCDIAIDNIRSTHDGNHDHCGYKPFVTNGQPASRACREESNNNKMSQHPANMHIKTTYLVAGKNWKSSSEVGAITHLQTTTMVFSVFMAGAEPPSKESSSIPRFLSENTMLAR